VFGPTTSVCLITAATLVANTDLGLHPLQLAAYLAFMIGVVQFVAGMFNFGEVTKFISRSVVVGYTTAIGVLLIFSQLHNGMGFQSPAGEDFLTTLTRVGVAIGLGNFSWWSIGIVLLTLAIFEGIKRWRPAWPEALLGLAFLAAAARVFAYFHPEIPFHLVKDEGALTVALPTLKHLPTLQDQLPVVRQLAGSAVAIAIIGMLEATAITKTLAARSGQRLDPNQELLGMGAGNIAAGLFGVTPGSSSFTRSAVNYQSGAVSQISSMLSSGAVLLILLFLTPVFNYIPVPALAAQLMRIGYRLINRSQIRFSTRSTHSDAVIFPVSFRGKLCAPMQQVNLGMIGGGTVGSGVFHALAAQRRPHGFAHRREGRRSAKSRSRRSTNRARIRSPRSLMTTDWQEVVNDPEIHIVAELVGGTASPAK
jgi:sulfate permease, SulP family